MVQTTIPPKMAVIKLAMTYQVELYTTTGNAARTAGRIDSILLERLQQPITRVVTSSKEYL
jgi:hypothetical protein